ncbi:MAG: hypothetical protein R2878_13085 [Thermoleophilia bacterium]
MRRPVDICSFTSGVAIAALGVMLGLAARGVFDLGFADLAPALLAAGGLALFTSGLRRGDRPGTGE